MDVLYCFRRIHRNNSNIVLNTCPSKLCQSPSEIWFGGLNVGGYFRRDQYKTGLTLKRCNQPNVFAIQLVDGDGSVVWLLENAKPLCAKIKGARREVSEGKADL